MRLVIKSVARKYDASPQNFIKWICEVFDLSSKGEEGGINEQILERIIAASKSGKGLSSSEIKAAENMARSTIIYHLNKLIDTGLVVKKGRKYYLRGSSVASSMREIEYDIRRELLSIEDAAEEFDRKFSKAKRAR